MPAFAATATFLVGSYFAGTSAAVRNYLPGGWIADAMRFSADPYRRVVDVLWTPSVSGASQVTAWCCLASVSLGIVMLSAVLLNRRRPVG